MITKDFFSAVITLLALTNYTFGQSDYEKEIDALMAKMTLEEKIGQMNMYTGFFDVTGPAPKTGNGAEKYAHLKNGWVGYA